MWSWLTPPLAVVLTMIAGGLMFAALGKNPFEAIRIIFWDPLFHENFAALLTTPETSCDKPVEHGSA